MKHTDTSRGIALLPIVAIVSAIVIIGIVVYVIKEQRFVAPTPADTTIEEDLDKAHKEMSAIDPDTETETTPTTTPAKPTEPTTPAPQQPITPVSFSGTVIAGSSSPLIEFNPSDYAKALQSGRLVVLYFYANWCPVCAVEAPRGLYPAFNELGGNRVVGFRVNFNDSDTDTNEEKLAREFGVPYQHTKVFLKNGKQVLKSPETWDKARYLSEIAKWSQ